MPFVQADGLRLHTQELGSGPALFLVHGLLIDNLASWFFTVAPLLAQHRRVVMHDLRGHGLSDPAESGYGSRSLAGDLGHLVDALAPGERIDLAGASFGSLVALRFALLHPQRVRSLVLVEAPLPPRRFQDIQPLLGAGLPAVVEALPEQVRANVGSSRRRTRRFAGAMQRLVTRTTMVPEVQAEQGIPEAELRALSLPVLCLYGSDSPCLPDGETLAGLLPDARLKVLAGGHNLVREAPAEVGAAMEAFLRG